MTGSPQLRHHLHLRPGMDCDQAAVLAGIVLEGARLADIEPLEPALLGHNNPPEEKTMANETVAADELRLLIERIERLEEEKKALSDDVRDVYAEAKARGYDTRTMREMVKLRKLEPQVRQEREALLDTYKAALGLDYCSTPLGRAALEAAESFDKLDCAVSMKAGDGEFVPLNRKAREAAEEKRSLTEKVGDVLDKIAAKSGGKITVERNVSVGARA